MADQMRAVPFGDDGCAGDSPFSPGSGTVDATEGSTFEELRAAWADLVLTTDHGFRRNGDGTWTVEDDDGAPWTMGLEEALEYLECDLDEAIPAGFWILDGEDLDKVLAASAVECWNDSSAYAVNSVAKRTCARFARRTVGTEPADG
jgi:hypothetical protein